MKETIVEQMKRAGKARWEDKTKKQIDAHISMLNEKRIEKMKKNKKLLEKLTKGKKI